jgi:hypothetical protein
MNSKNTYLSDGEYPSIAAHSFGTYILGYALQRYPYLKFDKVILCGSILPRKFCWKRILVRGQVKAVKNEYGVQDFWVRHAKWLIKDAGPSGYCGFETDCEEVIQDQFLYGHSEYLVKGHMEAFWIPFLLFERTDRTPNFGPTLPGFPEALPARPKTPMRGGGLRKRWRTSDGTILEWGHQQGIVEVYDRRGHHVGDFDPITGAARGRADPNRRIEP